MNIRRPGINLYTRQPPREYCEIPPGDMRIKIRKDERGETADIWDCHRETGSWAQAREVANPELLPRSNMNRCRVVNREIWAFPVRVFPPYNLKPPILTVNQRLY